MLEEIFDLRMFLVTILRRWRLLCIGILVGALVGFAFGARSYVQPSEVQGSEALGKLQSQTVDTSEQLALIKRAQQEAPLLQLEGADVVTARLTVYIACKDSAGNVAEGCGILPNVGAHLNDEDFYAALNDALELGELHYLPDLFEMTESSDMLQVAFSCNDRVLAAQVIEFAEEYINQMVAEAAASGCTHDIQFTRATSVGFPGAALMERQKQMTEWLVRTEQNLTMKVASAQLLSSNRSVIKYTALGGIGGLGLCLIWIFLREVISTVVSNSKELEKKYALELLGDLSNKR